jgi:hypothetical protein
MSLRLPQGARRLPLHVTLVAAAIAACAAGPAAANASTPTTYNAQYRQTDKAVVTAAHSVSRCQAKAGAASTTCAASRQALQKAGLKLSSISHHIARSSAATKSTLRASQQAPKLTAAGATLRWSKVAGVTAYVLVRKVSGKSDLYSAVNGTSTTPAPIPGKTVTYGLRTAVVGSAWAREVQIRYAAAGGGATTTTSPVKDTTTQPGTGTPAAGPSTPPAASTAPATGGAGGPNSSANFQMGIVSGSAISWQLGFITQLGAKHVRMEFDINTPTSEIAPIVLEYAQAGIQPLLLAGFQGRTPTATEAQNLATWAAAFGPGGTFWQGKDVAPSTAVTRIEFGNETNNPYQYNGWTLADDWYNNDNYLNLAKEYARQAKNAAIAVKAANPKVGILAVGDQYSGYTTWINAMFDAVPDLADHVAGWTVHPYGPKWQIPMDNMLAAMRSRGAVDKPLYATEWGISSDNGRCLSDNFGFDKCMTYATAATTLHDAIAGMRARYGSRLAALYLYSTSDLRATGASDDREHYFGALKSDKSAKGAFTSEVSALMGAGA